MISILVATAVLDAVIYAGAKFRAALARPSRRARKAAAADWLLVSKAYA